MRLFLPLFFLLAPLPGSAGQYGKLPLSFEPNQGQTDARVQFLSRSQGRTLFLTSKEAVLCAGGDVFRMQIVGANPRSRAQGDDRQAGRSNYFIGSNPAKWRTSIPNYGRVRFAGVYPGIDLVYYGRDGRLEYDWIVKPGADPARIRLRFAGIQDMWIDSSGDLVLRTPGGEIRQKKPDIYQNARIAGRYVIRHGNEAGFEIGPYDTRKPLVIDPMVIYSSYLGGNGVDAASGIAVDSNGQAYITGTTSSPNFPTVPPQPQGPSTSSAFITKVSADGKSLLYSTFLAGSSGASAAGIAVDAMGDAFIAGTTGSQEFPTVNAYQAHSPKAQGAVNSVFVTKLNPNGSALLFSTYLSGTKDDSAYGIAVDPSGNPYVTGFATSTDFPTVNPLQPTPGGLGDIFVSKFSAGGSTLMYSTYLGGYGADFGRAIAVDPSGNAYVTGTTVASNFPTVNAYQSTLMGSSSAFVSKINATGSALVYSTYFGGYATAGFAIAADSAGNAYITGADNNGGVATTAHAFQPMLHGGSDAFVAKFNPIGSLLYSTYLGGSSSDKGFGIAANALGQAWVTGITSSMDFPTVNPLMTARNYFDTEIFVTQLNATGASLLFSTYFGGPSPDGSDDEGHAIALDASGNAYVTGLTNSPNFPTMNAFQAVKGSPGYGAIDAFVLKLSGAAAAAAFNDFAGNGRSGALLYDPSNGVSYTALSGGNGGYSYAGNQFTPAFDTLRTGDFNGDGKADLVVYNSHTALAYIGMGNGDGTFAFQSLFWSPGYDFVEAGDLNGDGKTDFALYNSSTGTMYTGIGNGAGTFTYKYTLISKNYTVLRLADFTGDGKADIFLYNAADGTAYLGVGDGTGGFAFHALFVSPGYNLVDVGDLNGDGRADVILYNASNGSAATGISDGAGGFAFTPLGFSPGFTSVRLADYTGDGKADVTVYNKNTAVAYFGTGAGTGSFSFQSLFWSPGYDYVVPEDVNGDGKADVVLYNSATGTEYTGVGNGAGAFTYTYQYWGIGKTLAR